MKKVSALFILFALTSNACVFSQEQSEASGSVGGVQSGTLAPTDKLSVSYENLRSIWDDCYQLRNLGQDLANEGKNAPPRLHWLSYFVDTIGQILPRLQAEVENLEFPKDLAPVLAQQKSDIQSMVTQLQADAVELQAAAGQVTDPVKAKYPPVYWKPAAALTDKANKLDALLLAVYSTLDSSADNTVLLNASKSPVSAANTPAVNANSASGRSVTQALIGSATAGQAEQGIKSISDAGTRVSKSAFGLIGELERWNLLYGKPPKNGPAGMFYGGGLTEQEVLTQYRYLPTTVFTMPAYVKLYSYRLPPRQNMLAYYTAQIGGGLNLMEADLREVALPQDKEASLGGPWEEVKRTFMDSRSQYLNLLQLVNASNDERLQKSIREDELAFGAPVSAIYNNMNKLQSLLTDLKTILK